MLCECLLVLVMIVEKEDITKQVVAVAKVILMKVDAII